MYLLIRSEDKRPETRFNNEDLPDPEGPMIALTFPALKVADMLSKMIFSLEVLPFLIRTPRHKFNKLTSMFNFSGVLTSSLTCSTCSNSSSCFSSGVEDLTCFDNATSTLLNFNITPATR